MNLGEDYKAPFGLWGCYLTGGATASDKHGAREDIPILR